MYELKYYQEWLKMHKEKTSFKNKISIYKVLIKTPGILRACNYE